MDYLKNHCWCSSSHWDGDHYDCSIIVTLSSYKEGYKEDWEKLTHKVKVFDQKTLDRHNSTMKWMQEKYPEEDFSSEVGDSVGWVTVNTLKPEVLDWLNENIPDIKEKKAWCIGSDSYIAGDSCSSFSIFMQRRKDAMKFIKIWSKWKKPVHYCQYFTDVRKELDLVTLKYKEE